MFAYVSNELKKDDINYSNVEQFIGKFEISVL